MSDEAAFLRAILANPGDAAAYLVYADWLDERGEAERAGYLRTFLRRPQDAEGMNKLGALVGTLWMGTQVGPPPWDARALQALGRLEGLLFACEQFRNRPREKSYYFGAELFGSDRALDELQKRVPAGPAIARKLDDWAAEAQAAFCQWLLGVPGDNDPAALPLLVRHALNCVRDVLRPVRGMRFTVEVAEPRGESDILVLEAEDRTHRLLRGPRLRHSGRAGTRHFGGMYPTGATTTSKSDPLSFRSSSCSTGIRGSGAHEIAHSMPLSATSIP
jgi:uncharacterized protein (TIGR02996 family)